jgi:hypothetical protein
VISTLAMTTAVVALVLVSGCSTSTAGSAGPQGNPPPATTTGAAAPTGDNGPSSSSANTFGAPKVTTPLDTTKFQSTPCSVLTSAQQHSFGITAAGKTNPDPAGAICNWDLDSGPVYSFGFDVKFADGDAKGLANAYEVGGSEMKALPDIGGQPAVTQPSQNVNGDCTIWIGATDDIEYAVDVAIPTGPDDPCTVATQIATAATSTMKSGA